MPKHFRKSLSQKQSHYYNAAEPLRETLSTSSIHEQKKVVDINTIIDLAL